MCMNYIGSKYSLLDFLKVGILETLKNNNEQLAPSEMVFADLFAGTCAVGGAFKSLGFSIIANDIQYYSYVFCKHLIENNGNLDNERCNSLIKQLNNLDGIEGFIYDNYSLGGTSDNEVKRMYFTDNNAKKCDAIRIKIQEWKETRYINNNEYFFLLASLINCMDKVANTASVYGAYLKKFKTSAQKDLLLTPIQSIEGKVKSEVYNEDITKLINKISGDILYLDPPYNARQYCTNYHLLETIARYDNPEIYGKTGLREYQSQKSVFCNSKKVAEAFEYLIKNADFKYIFVSYNNEGLMSLSTIENIMKKYGKYSLYSKEYKRFKADNARTNSANSTTEYLHCLIKK